MRKGGRQVALLACRYKLEAAQRLQEREKTKVLKSLMYSLVNSTMNDGKTPAEQLRNARNLAFVVTDLQSSTAQAAASPHAFLKVQEIHDTVGSPFLCSAAADCCCQAAAAGLCCESSKATKGATGRMRRLLT